MLEKSGIKCNFVEVSFVIYLYNQKPNALHIMENQNQTEISETYQGRPIKQKISFDEKGEWKSLRKAKDWLKENGYSFGSLARTMPVGIKKGDCDIAKWYNLYEKEIAELDGVMLFSNRPRDGKVEILLFN